MAFPQPTLSGAAAALCLAAAIVAAPGQGRASVLLAPAFTGPALDAGLAYAGSPGTTDSVAGGTLTLTLPAGTRTGDVEAYVYTSALFSGDFTVAVTADASRLGQADLGVLVGEGDFSDARADLFLNGTSHTVDANIFDRALVSPAFAAAAATTVDFTVARIGDTIYETFDDGSGPTLIQSGANDTTGDPTRISLFLLEPYEVADSSAQTGSFTHLSVTNAEITVPEPTSLALCGTLLALAAGSASRRRAAPRRCPPA